jgi:histone deacetylase HOS3
VGVVRVQHGRRVFLRRVLAVCPGSIDAIQGALGTVCEAVDSIMAGTISRAFVAIRPPGHHCGEDAPSGFCFVNNVAVAAAHGTIAVQHASLSVDSSAAHLAYKAHRAVIFDIDLHHGNGTQAIVWQINEESYRQKLEDDANPAATGEGRLQVFYGSIHDILSYPCEVRAERHRAQTM